LDTALHIVGLVLLVLTCLLAVAMTAVRLPGTWIMIAAAVLYDWSQDWQRLGGPILGILVGAAVLGEALEMLTSAMLARRAGASRRAQWGSIIGGILGMIFLSFLIPIPVVGSVIGALVGCFSGAAIAELSLRRNLGQGARVGTWSAIGFALGTAAKTAIASFMAALLLSCVFFSNGPPQAPPSPTIQTHPA